MIGVSGGASLPCVYSHVAFPAAMRVHAWMLSHPAVDTSRDVQGNIRLDTTVNTMLRCMPPNRLGDCECVSL